MFKPEPNSQSEPKRIHNKAQARESASDKVATSFTLPFDWLRGHVSFETITELFKAKPKRLWWACSVWKTMLNPCHVTLFQNGVPRLFIYSVPKAVTTVKILMQ